MAWLAGASLRCTPACGLVTPSGFWDGNDFQDLLACERISKISRISLACERAITECGKRSEGGADGGLGWVSVRCGFGWAKNAVEAVFLFF